MDRVRPTITCACCGKTGRHQGRGLILACYERHQEHGTIERFPRRIQPSTWRPTRPAARRFMEQYAELAAIRPPLSTRRIAWELGVTERTVQRYAAALRTQRQAVA
ncbi:hypothetical protein ACIBG7_18755 [Nonomuraea sp. NPDC050328]|uniref:hypothetical protein n=1 Tax=Nonomuraea sp. NPDC050328 TaxID=3364361 RepID=UPI0037AD6D45